MFNVHTPSPHCSQSQDVRIVINFLSNYKSLDISVLQFAKKAAILFALTDAHADLAALDRDYARWTASGVELTVIQLTKTRKSGPSTK